MNRKQRTLLFALLFVALSSSIRGQSIEHSLSPISFAMGGNSTTVRSLRNPASTAWRDSAYLSIGMMNWWQIPGLMQGAVTGEYTLPAIHLQAFGSIFGSAQYMDALFAIGASKQLGRTVTLGIGVTYHHRTGYSDTDRAFIGNRLSTQIGVQYRPIQQLTIGFQTTDLLQIGFSDFDSENRPPVEVAIGVSYDILSSLSVHAEWAQLIGVKPRFSIAAEYYILPYLPIRIGVYGPEVAPTAGIGYRFGRFAVDAAFDFAYHLGTRSTFTLAYAF